MRTKPCDTCKKETEVKYSGYCSPHVCPLCNKFRCIGCYLKEKNNGFVGNYSHKMYCPECFENFVTTKRNRLVEIESEMKNIISTISESTDPRWFLEKYFDLKNEHKNIKGMYAEYRSTGKPDHENIVKF